MKRIAFHLNALTRGGAERVVTNLADRFAAEGYEVCIATEWTDAHEFVPDRRVRRVHVGLQPADEGKNRIGKFLTRIRNLRTFMEETHPDVLVSFGKKANYRALMAAKHTAVPVVISVRSNPATYYADRTDPFLIRHLFPRAAGAVFQTEEQRRFFAPLLQERSRIILNPVHDKYFEAVRPAEKVKVVVQHGRLDTMKNQEMLIRAFVRVHAAHPDYVLKIYGDEAAPGMRAHLEQVIAEQEADGYIFLPGASDTLEELLPRCAVYAFSSDWEGLPNALLEAMAVGLPVVATDCPCGGPASVIRHEENGLLIPVGDTDAMATSILRLIEDPALAARLGEQAAGIKARTASDTVFRQWETYLQEITDTGRFDRLSDRAP